MGGQFEVKDGATKKYYSLAGMMVAVNDGTGLQYLLTDHLGSTVAVTNQSGTLTSQQRYLPFGAARTIPNSPILGTDFTYTGQRKLDDGMGRIMDYKARFYSVGLGRFIQPDSIIPDQSNPQSWNRMSYVRNNPVKFNDPTGHMEYCDEACEHDNEPTNLPAPQGRGGDDDLDLDTNENGVPDVPDPDLEIPGMSGICQYDTLTECLYAGDYLPDGDFYVTDEDWRAFLLALYYDVNRRVNEGDGFWTSKYDPLEMVDLRALLRGESYIVPFHTEAYFQRVSYDTPLWDASGTLQGNICFSNGNCHNRTDVNYVAQGMWSGGGGEGGIGAIIAANAWKQGEYGKGASPEVVYWSVYGALQYGYIDQHPYVRTP